MKETTFIKQNKKKWARFEKLSKNKNNNPDEVSQLFIEITEDLSYAKTFYPRRSVRVYLNQLAQGVFTSLYKQRKQPLGSFGKFWVETVPLEMYRARKNLLTAFIFFLLAALIGAISQHYDHAFVRLILGDHYVNETIRRIDRGDPMGVYGETPGGSMFFMITLNNLMVAFITFALGILGTIGTFFMLLRNGVMLGAFQWWFKAKGLLLTSFLAVWIHGAFEISAIVIAGAAGITVGNGFLFPKSYTRSQSLIFAAKRGLAIMLSLIPIFILAGALESFVTRHYKEIPEIIKWLIILGSFTVIILYYVIYPFIVARKHPDKIAVKEVPRYIPDRKIEWYKIRKVNEIFTDTFYLFIAKIGQISKIFFTVVFPLLLVMLGLVYYLEGERFNYLLRWHQNLITLFGATEYMAWYKVIGWTSLMSLTMCAVLFVVQRDDKEEQLFSGYFKFVLRHGLWLLIFSFIVYALMLFTHPGVLLLAIFITPFLCLIPGNIVFKKLDFFRALGQSFSLGKGSYGDIIGAFCLTGLITVIFFFTVSNPIEFMSITSIIDEIIKEFTISVVDDYAMIIQLVNSFIYLLFIFLSLVLFTLTFAFLFYTNEEKITAKGLYDRLEKFGKRNKNYETDIDYE